jgi:hypothetical protein
MIVKDSDEDEMIEIATRSKRKKDNNLRCQQMARS